MHHWRYNAAQNAAGIIKLCLRWSWWWCAFIMSRSCKEYQITVGFILLSGQVCCEVDAAWCSNLGTCTTWCTMYTGSYQVTAWRDKVRFPNSLGSQEGRGTRLRGQTPHHRWLHKLHPGGKDWMALEENVLGLNTKLGQEKNKWNTFSQDLQNICVSMVES